MDLIGDGHEVALLHLLRRQFLLLEVDAGAFASVTSSAPLFLLGLVAGRKDALKAVSGLLRTVAGFFD